MFKPKNDHERIQHRLKIVLGHYKKVMKMVDEDAYCIDILHQSQAVQKAMREIDNLLLKHHLNGCVTDAIKQNENPEKAMLEILDVFKKQTVR